MKPGLQYKLAVVHDRVSAALNDLAELFTGDMRLTFVARHPTSPESFVVVTADDLRAVATTLTRQADKEQVPARAADGGGRGGS